MKRYSTFMHKFMFSTLASTALLLCTACKDNINTMIEDYNSHFEPATNMDIIVNPGDKGFKEEDMLAPNYAISSEGSINVCAPYKCSMYKWTFYKVTNIKNGSETEIHSELTDITDYLSFHEGSGKDKREFRVNVAKSYMGEVVNGSKTTKSKLSTGTYILHLKVIGDNGKTYNDYCKIIIYEQIYEKADFFKED